MSPVPVRVDRNKNELILDSNAVAGDSLGSVLDVYRAVKNIKDEIYGVDPFASIDRLLAWTAGQKGRSASVVTDMGYGLFTAVTIRISGAKLLIEFTVPLSGLAAAIDHACSLLNLAESHPLELTEKKP